MDSMHGRRVNPRYGLLWALISSLLVASCTTPVVPTGEPVTITFACMDHQRDRYEDLVKDFEKTNPDVRVQIVSADEASGMQRQGGTVTSSGDEVERLAAAADTFVWFARLQPTDWPYLLNLQPFVDDASSFPADDFYPGTLDDLRWQHDLYGLPAEVLPILIFYDKGMFDEAAVAYPEIGWTWDDFLEAADRLTEREEGEVSRYGFVDSHFSNTVLAMMHQYGVPLWDDHVDPPRPLFDRPEVADVLRHYVDLALTYEVMPTPEIGSNVMASNLVNEGRAAMWTDFAFNYDYRAHRTNLGVAPFPEKVAAAHPRNTYGFFAGAGTAHPDAAWRWLTYLSENYQSLLDGSLAGRRSVSEESSWWRELDGDAKAVIEYALTNPSPPSNPLNLPLTRAIATVIEGQTSVDDALAMAQAQALELQAELTHATPAAPQPVAPPGPTPGGTQTTIRFAPPPASDAAVYRQLADRFREIQSGVQVEITSSYSSLEALAQDNDCFGGTLPIDAAEVRQHVRSLQPLLGADTDFDPADFYPVMLEPLRHDGELWGIPYEADTLMVYYNRDRLVESGVALPEPGWIIDDFLDTALALSVDDGDLYGFTTREGAYGDLIFVLERMGARLFDGSAADGNAFPFPTFDDPTVVSALARYADVARLASLSPATPPRQIGWPDARMMGDHPAGVRSEQVAMWVDYFQDYAVSPPLPFETSIAPLPVASGSVGIQTTTEFNVSAYYISAHTAEPQACWEWLTFLSAQPEVTQLLPARRSIVESSSWQSRVSEEDLAAYRAILGYDDTRVFALRWDIPWLGYAYPWLDEAFQAVLTGDGPERALAGAQHKAETYVRCLEREGSFVDRDVLRACAGEADPDYPAVGE
jgi:ABC-type glycerol-3-phosphate transport system substrate-binding protein